MELFARILYDHNKLAQALTISSLGATTTFFILPPICMSCIQNYGAAKSVYLLVIMPLSLFIFSYLLDKHPKFIVEKPILFDKNLLFQNKNYQKAVIGSMLLWMGFWGSQTWLPQWLEYNLINVNPDLEILEDKNLVKILLMSFAIFELISRTSGTQLVKKIKPVTILFFVAIGVKTFSWCLLYFTKFITPSYQFYFIQICLCLIGVSNGLWPGIHVWIVSLVCKQEQNVQAIGMLTFFCGFTNYLIVQLYCILLKYDYRLLNLATVVFYTLCLILFKMIKV